MVSVGLLQRLEAEDGVHGVDASESAILDSVLFNLRILLNSSEGCCEIRPDFGLTDFNGSTNNYMNTAASVARDIEKQIRKFEPRLRNVLVRAIEDQDRPLEFVFHVDAEIAYEDKAVKVKFNSVLGSDGHVRFNA